MDSGKAMAATVVHADEGLEYVLVVDDEPVVRRFVARALTENGFGVREADDGAMALELIRSGEVRPAVVLCDIVMPRMNGVQLLESLTVSRPGLPIILMSGYGAAELAEKGIASPCAVLAKPFTAEMLVAEVRRCLRVR